jgi:hypothetical protein
MYTSARRETRSRWTISLFTVAVTATCLTASANADKKDLIRAAKTGGGQSSLFEKLVVISKKARLLATPDDSKDTKGDFISPFSVFFRMKTANGAKEQNGCYRVGDSDGTPLGWIQKEHVKSWNTRFVLEPLEPRPSRTFTVELDKDEKAELRTLPGGTRRFAFITNSPPLVDGKENPNGPFPVVVCTQLVKSTADGNDLNDELQDLRNLKLEVVFVVESTDFMLADFGGNLTVKQTVQNMMKAVVRDAAEDEVLSKKKSVRFGLAEYQDCNRPGKPDIPQPKFVSRMTQPLTNDFDRFLKAVDNFEPIAIGGDWPEDALSGLNTALDRAGWEKNSTKHIILVASGNMHHHRYGAGPNQYGSANNFRTRLYDRTDRQNLPFLGQNSSGISLQQLLAKANPEGGAIEVKARNAKRFHAILSGKPLPEKARNNKAFLKAVDALVQMTNAQLNQLIAEDPKFRDYFDMACLYKMIQNTRANARTDFRELTDNRGNSGLFMEMLPTEKSALETSKKLEHELKLALVSMRRLLDGILTTEGLESPDSGVIAQSLYVLVGAAKDKFKDSPVLSGTAQIRDRRGRQVAKKKMMINKEELIRLKSTLEALHTKFKGKVAKVQRADVSRILDDLKETIAKAGAGQKQIAADVKLKDLISDLPLRTTSLDTTPGDIAVMSSDAFRQWLNKLESAIFVAEDLIEKGSWMYLSRKATNDKFTFLHISQLP